MALDLSRLRADPWRWLCVECGAEGRGGRPYECPSCGCGDAWYETSAHGDDPRSMADVWEAFQEMLLGAPRGRWLH